MNIANVKEFSLHLSRVVTVIACCLFMVSVLFPFLTVSHRSIIPEDTYRATYWSYKATVRYLKLGYEMNSETLFFSAYWFAQEKPYSYPTPSDLGVSWSLVAIFVTQILTLGSGVAALFRHGKSMQFLPLIPCLSVIILMVHIIVQTHHPFSLLKCELGCWLSFTSAVLFLCGLIVYAQRED